MSFWTISIYATGPWSAIFDSNYSLWKNCFVLTVSATNVINTCDFTHTFLRDFFALRFLPQPISRGLCKPVIVTVGHPDILLSWNHLGSSHLSKLYSSLRYHRCSCHFHSTSPQVFPDWQGVGLLVPSDCPRIVPYSLHLTILSYFSSHHSHPELFTISRLFQK